MPPALAGRAAVAISGDIQRVDRGTGKVAMPGIDYIRSYWMGRHHGMALD